MRPRYPPEADVFREKIQAFLAEQLPADWDGIGALDHEAAETFVTGWRRILFENDLLALSWPTEYGGPGLTSLEQVVLAEEFTLAGVPTGGPNDPLSIQMVGNTIIRWGTENQKLHYLPRILSGEDVWCQGYSEPIAGSDLANYIFVLTRTAPDAAKHKGISFLLVSMDQPGVEVRPISMMSGDSEFNEVFFTDARAPRDNIVGEVNGGWAVAMTLLGYERGEAAATLSISYRRELDRLTELAIDIIGSEAMVPTGRSPASVFSTDSPGVPATNIGSWCGAFLNARAGTIYAGTSEIQRNILGEMVLGLPKEPRADTGAWKDRLG